MNSRLARVVLVIFVGFVVGVGVLVTVMRWTAAPSPYMSVFAFPDGTPCARPCLFGIRPGETSYARALELLATHPVTRGLNRVERVFDNGMMFEGAEFIAAVTRDASGEVNQVWIEMEPSNLDRNRGWADSLPELPNSVLKSGTLAEAIAALGPPDYVEMRDLSVGRAVRIHYQNDFLTVTNRRLDQERVSAGDSLLGVFMYTRPADVTPNLFRWSGFTSLRRYSQQAQRR